MVISIFTTIGLWVVALIITFIFVCLLAYSLNNKWIADHDEEAFIASVIMFIVIVELFLSITFVLFKSNPEKFGYTRIEQEIGTEVMDE